MMPADATRAVHFTVLVEKCYPFEISPPQGKTLEVQDRATLGSDSPVVERLRVGTLVYACGPDDYLEREGMVYGPRTRVFLDTPGTPCAGIRTNRFILEPETSTCRGGWVDVAGIKPVYFDPTRLPSARSCRPVKARGPDHEVDMKVYSLVDDSYVLDWIMMGTVVYACDAKAAKARVRRTHVYYAGPRETCASPPVHAPRKVLNGLLCHQGWVETKFVSGATVHPQP